MEAGHCHLCKQPVVWVRTTWGASIPIDPDPAKDGDLVIICGVVQPPLSDVLMQILGSDLRYKQHVATCPVGTKAMKEARAKDTDEQRRLRLQFTKGPTR